MPGVEGRVWNYGVSVGEIVRRGNVETGFVPEEGQSQKGSMQEKDRDKDDRVEMQRAKSRRKLASLLHPRCQWICPGVCDMVGSSVMSPNVFSYWITFCCRMVISAFACCGLR